MDHDVPASFRVLLLPGLMFVAALYLCPLLLMLGLAVTEPAPGLSNFGWMAGSTAVRTIAWTTLRFSATASAISVLAAFAVAYVIWLGTAPVARLLTLVVLVSFWLSVLIRCFSLILILGPNGPFPSLFRLLGLPDLRLIRNEPGVLVGMVQYLIPFAVLTILLGLKRIDLTLIAAARSMGATRIRILRTVILPLSAPAVLSAFGLCFVISLGFYITPALLGGGRVVMMAEFVTFHVQNVLAWGKASALALLLLAFIGASYGGIRLAAAALRRSNGPAA